MNQESQRGAASIIGLGVALFLFLGGTILMLTHKPGNPPFSFTDQKTATTTPAAETKGINQVTSQKKAVTSTEPKKLGSVPTVQKQPAPTREWFSAPQQRCTSNISPQFTHAFTDLSMIDALNPIGGIGGGSPGRSYIGVKKGLEAPIYAPADLVLNRIIYADRGAGYGEYGIFLQASCEVEILFDHIDRLSDTILPYAPKTAVNVTQANQGAEMNVRIKAGQLLGYTNGTELARTFDFLVQNFGRKNVYINPARWEWDQAVYGSCPYDYFSPDLKAQYYEKLGKPSDAGLIKSAVCGNPSNDVAGTASGGWFKGASTDKRGEYLAIARQYNEAQIATRLDGQAFASTQDVQTGNPLFRLTDYSPEKYPADIKPGDSVCYSDNSQWAFIKLVSETELSFAKGSGSCPSTFPDSQASAWIR